MVLAWQIARQVSAQRHCCNRARAPRVAAAHADKQQLEAQKGELLALVKQYARLVDNLRRQKAHVEAATLLGLSQAEVKAALGH